MRRPLAAIALGALIAGCGGDRPARRDWKAQQVATPLAVQAAEIRAGELLIWEVTFRDIPVGELVMATGEPGDEDGRAVAIVRSRMQTTGLAALISDVNDEYTTVVDLQTARPLRHHAKVDEDEWREIAFDDGGVSVTYAEDDERKTVHQKMPKSAYAFDLNSVLFALRSWSETDKATFHLLGSTHLWRSRVDVRGREAIRTPLGKREAIRIDGYAERVTRAYRPDPDKEPRSYSIWYSADPDRLPLRIVGHAAYGDMRLDLVEYRWRDRVLSAQLAR